jgi:hypothetical protein
MNRREFGVALAGAIAAGVSCDGPKKQVEAPTLQIPTPKTAAEILADNEEQLNRLKKDGVRYTMDRYRKQGHHVLVKGNPTVQRVKCIDERDKEGVVHCVAGIGVHQTPGLRQQVASGIIRDANRKWEELKESGNEQRVTISLEWHGDAEWDEEEKAKSCGAALLSLKARFPNRKQHFSPKEINDEAKRGAEEMKREIESQLKAMGMSDRFTVVVTHVPQQNFVDSPEHPGGAVFINGDPEREFNRQNGSGLLFYGTDYALAPKSGIGDAVVAGQIMKGNHGRNALHGAHDQHTGQREDPIYIPIGPEIKLGSIRRDLEGALSELPKDKRESLGNVRIEPYVWR